MSIDYDMINFTQRADGRYDVRYADEPILVSNNPPETEFKMNALRILVERHLKELNRHQRAERYRHSERSARE